MSHWFFFLSHVAFPAPIPSLLIWPRWSFKIYSILNTGQWKKERKKQKPWRHSVQEINIFMWEMMLTDIMCVCACSVAQLCPTLCNPMDCSLPSSSQSMGFSRQEYCDGLPFSTPGDLPNPGIKPISLASPELMGGFFNTAPLGKPHVN